MDRSFFLFVTIHAFARRTDTRTDGRTDRQFLVASPRWHSMQRGNNPKLLPVARFYVSVVVAREFPAVWVWVLRSIPVRILPEFLNICEIEWKRFKHGVNVIVDV